MPQAPSRPPAQPHRPDIDGLRGLAVLLVVLFHLDTRFTGGFIGVDVFFVISGYLISAVILSDLAANNFSLLNFYERRIRRILPALLAMLAVTSVLAWRFLIPSELVAYGRSQAATLASVSNILFRSQAAYFDTPSTFKPLLHTWSLGVEEQFYLVFPLLLLAIHRAFPQRLRLILYTLTAASFAASAIMVVRDRNAAFFLAPFRAWELLLGALVSQKFLPTPSTRITRNIASAAGLLLILWPALHYASGTRFPGPAALAPCVGAALILAAGQTGPSLAASALAARPIAFIGLISYSLYLWHWPLLVFQRSDSLLFPNPLTRTTTLLFLALVIAIASLSWAFIEQPFRTGRLRPNRRTLFIATGSATATLAAASVALVSLQGFPSRFPPAAQTVAAFATYDRAPSTRDGLCYLQPTAAFTDFHPDPCLLQRPGRKSILLAGDSHAAALFPGLARVFPDRDILQANVSSCRAAPVEPPHSAAICSRLNAFLFDDFLPTHHVDTLLLAAKWSPSDFDSLAHTIQFAQSRGIAVVLIGPGIEYDNAMPRILAIALRNGDLQQAARHRDLAPQRLDAVMATLAATVWHVPYISIYRDLCTPACPLYAVVDVPLLFDSHHFTEQGAILLAQAIRSRNELP
jgi:peptidoglycan/LPS O-acetylase OafA/YrhL